MRGTAATADLEATCWGWGMLTSQMMKQAARKPTSGRWAAAQAMQSSCDWLLHWGLKQKPGADSALPDMCAGSDLLAAASRFVAGSEDSRFRQVPCSTCDAAGNWVPKTALILCDTCLSCLDVVPHVAA